MVNNIRAKSSQQNSIKSGLGALDLFFLFSLSVKFHVLEALWLRLDHILLICVVLHISKLVRIVEAEDVFVVVSDNDKLIGRNVIIVVLLIDLTHLHVSNCLQNFVIFVAALSLVLNVGLLSLNTARTLTPRGRVNSIRDVHHLVVERGLRLVVLRQFLPRHQRNLTKLGLPFEPLAPRLSSVDDQVLCEPVLVLLTLLLKEDVLVINCLLPRLQVQEEKIDVEFLSVHLAISDLMFGSGCVQGEPFFSCATHTMVLV